MGFIYSKVVWIKKGSTILLLHMGEYLPLLNPIQAGGEGPRDLPFRFLEIVKKYWSEAAQIFWLF